MLGDAGFVTLEAVRWLADVGVSMTHLDSTGRPLMATAVQRLDDARLRRTQALAATHPVGMEIARTLIRDKLHGQRRVLVHLGAPDVAEFVTSAIAAVGRVANTRSLLAVESEAAASYWSAWRSLRVCFSARDAARVSEHWLVFGQRQSILTGVGPRRAANPANALLNYLYGVLEAETVVTLRTMGLDPGLGLFHVDQAARDSLALDVMEPARPEVDRYVLDLLEHQVFTLDDFAEGRDGWCRLSIRLAHQLALTSGRWGNLMGPVVEGVVAALGRGGIDAGPEGRKRRSVVFSTKSQETSIAIPTLLTNARRKAARPAGEQVRSAGHRADTGNRSRRACASCGEKPAKDSYRYCDACRDELVHPGRRSTIRGETASARCVRRFLVEVGRLTSAEWKQLSSAADGLPHDRIAAVVARRAKRVAVREAKNRAALSSALATCPPDLVGYVASVVSTVALAIAVRDLLPSGVFEAAYRPMAQAVRAEAWDGDEIMSHTERAEIIAGYRAGASASSLAAERGMSTDVVLRRLRAVGEPLRPSVRITDPATLKARRARGESVAALADAYGVSQSAIRYRLARQPLPTLAPPAHTPVVASDITGAASR